MCDRYHSPLHEKQYNYKMSTDKPYHLGFSALPDKQFLKSYHIPRNKKTYHQLFHLQEK